jgi:hypothetical protein
MRNHGHLLRRLLEPPARDLGVDYDPHTLFMYGSLARMPGGRPEDVAFGLLAVGGTILATKTYSDEFPASGRTARKGAKLLRSMLGEPESIEAAAMLARAQALLAADRLSRTGSQRGAAWQRATGNLLQEHVPIGPERTDELDNYLNTSFERARELRGHEAAERAAATAAVYFQQWATLGALNLALGEEFMESQKTLDHLILPGTGARALTEGAADHQAHWLPAEKRRTRYVQQAINLGFI